MALVKVRQVAGLLLVTVLFFSTAQNSTAAGKMLRVERTHTFAPWEEVQAALSELFGAPRVKSGSSADPDGHPHTAPGSTTADSGSSADPDGKK